MFNKKEKTISLDALFEDTKPSFKTYKVIPDFDISNNQNEVIARSISTLYKTPLENFTLDVRGMQVTYTAKRKIMFDILLVPGNAHFYFTIPIESEDLFLGKIRSIWNNSAIMEVDKKELETLNDFRDNVTASNLVLKTFNFKSLNTAKDNLYPLTNMVGITSQLKADRNEMVRLNFDIAPIKRDNWINKAKDEYDALKKGKTVDNEKSLRDNVMSTLFKVFEFGINTYIDFRLMIFESLLGVMFNEKEEIGKNGGAVAFGGSNDRDYGRGFSGRDVFGSSGQNEISPYTRHKMNSEAFSTGITIISKSDDTNRRNTNLVAVANSYKDINGDNELVVKKLSESQQKRVIRGVISGSSTKHSRSILSDMEVAKIIQLPQKNLQQLYKLDNIDAREVSVPKELLKKGISIGTVEVKRKKEEVYWSTEYNSAALPKIVAGCPGSGKSKYTEGFIVGANKLGQCTITFDYIKNCELTDVASSHTKNNVIIDLSSKDEIFSFAYPELSGKINENTSSWDRIETATEIAKQVRYLVNSVTDDTTGKLTAPMSRFLMAASRLVFVHEGEKVDNVFKVLESWETRNEYIRKSKGIYDYDDRVISTLKELNDTDGEGRIVGTKHNLIQGVLNRIDILLDDPRLERMLRADIDTKHNFTQYMNEGKAIYIKIPQSTFRDATTKDIIVTYFLTRIWSAALERSSIDKPNITHIITDEVHQVPIAADFMKNHITEFRKFGLAPLFTIHYLKQFKSLLDAVKSSGASYMLLAGLEKDNLNVLKEEISPFTIEDAMNLKQWESLNVIRHSNQYSNFISTLPTPLN